MIVCLNKFMYFSLSIIVSDKGVTKAVLFLFCLQLMSASNYKLCRASEPVFKIPPCIDKQGASASALRRELICSCRSNSVQQVTLVTLT